MLIIELAPRPPDASAFALHAMTSRISRGSDGNDDATGAAPYTMLLRLLEGSCARVKSVPLSLGSRQAVTTLHLQG